MRAFNHDSQRFEHGRQIGLELLDGLPEFRDFSSLVAEEEREQLLEFIDIIDRALHHLLAVLYQHGAGGVLEDDVVLRITALELFNDLFIEIICAVLGFPVAERHAQFIEQRAIDVALIPGQGIESVFRDEDEIMLLAPAFEQVFERFAQHAFARGAGDLAEILQLIEVVLDECVAHYRRILACVRLTDRGRTTTGYVLSARVSTH